MKNLIQIYNQKTGILNGKREPIIWLFYIFNSLDK